MGSLGSVGADGECDGEVGSLGSVGVAMDGAVIGGLSCSSSRNE